MLDPWLVAIYVDAWAGVPATSVVGWTNYSTLRETDAGLLTRSHMTLLPQRC